MADAPKKEEKEYEDILTTGMAYQKERLYVREMTAFTYGLREELNA